MKSDKLLNWMIVGALALVGATSIETITRKAGLIGNRTEKLEQEVAKAPAPLEPTPEVNLYATAPSGTEYDHSFDVSQDGLDFITGFEGFEPKPYLCPAGKPTIGYGHVIQPGEKFTSLTKAQAQELFRNDLARYTEAVDNNVKVAIDQSQYDALTSFAFNAGTGALKESTLMKKLNRGDYEGASNEFQKWNKITRNGKKIPSKGLTNRRAGEKRMFNGGRR